MGTWIEAIGTLLLGSIGLWAANNYRLGIRASLTERTAQAYARLWEVMGEPDTFQALSHGERAEVSAKMHVWYFRNGDGMFMPAPTRRLFFKVKNNLMAEPETVEPASFRAVFKKQGADPELVFKCLMKRQFSLLRTQLKSDLTLHAMTPTFSALKPDELQLLRDCAIRRSPIALSIAFLLRRSDTRLPPTSTSKPMCLCGQCPTGSRTLARA
jgi:hypothetical protein